MATRQVEIERDRKTYIKGTLRGKYWAQEDTINSNRHSGHFNLNIYEAIIRADNINKHPDGEFDEFKSVPISISKLPNPITVFLKTEDFKEIPYELNIHESKLNNIVLDKVVVEPENRFGRIRADIQVYILDKTTETITEEIPEPTIEEPLIAEPEVISSKTAIEDNWIGNPVFLDEYYIRPIKRAIAPNKSSKVPQERKLNLWEWVLVGLLLFFFLTLLIFIIWKKPFLLVVGAIVLFYMWFTN